MNRIKNLVCAGAQGNATSVATNNRCADLIRECLNDHQSLVSYDDLKAARDVLRKTASSSWQSPALRDSAIESARGFALSVVNRLPKQASLHMQQLQHMCNRNIAHLTIEVLRDYKLDAKPFANCSDTSVPIQIKGHGYTWNVQSIDQAEETIPSHFLERLTLLRARGIEPDQIYVGVPFSPNKPSLTQVLVQEAKAGIAATSEALKKAGQFAAKQADETIEVFKMPDPVLLVGFGLKPCIMVEIGRWV